MLYFAYGTNLNLRAMKRRCPGAQPLSAADLKDYKLRFCRYVDIFPVNGSEVAGAVFKLTPACVRALDSYEGPEYEQITVQVIANGRKLKAMAYAMSSNAKIAPPDINHYREIARGYQDWKLDDTPLRRARYDTLNAMPGNNQSAEGNRAARQRATWDPASSPTGDVIRAGTGRSGD